MSSPPSDLEVSMRATTESFVYAFNGTWRVDSAAVSARAPGCIHTIFPSSLGIPKRNNEEFADHLRGLEGLFTGSVMVIDDYVSALAERRSVCRTSVTPTTPVGPYKNEYVWFLSFTEDGKKIIKIEEFLDAMGASGVLRNLGKEGFLKKH